MRRTGSGQHFFTVRGRGFDDKQWREILRVSQEIVDRAKEDDTSAKIERGPRCFVVTPKGDGQPLVLWRDGEPDVPTEIVAEGPFDDVVQSVLTAVKKIAPDLLVVTSPDGRDYRRVLAKARSDSAWSRIKHLKKMPQTRLEAFLRAMSREKWRHPETKNMVEFVSLPKKEQTKLRREWDQEYGDRYEQELERARKETAEAHREVEEAGSAVRDLERARDRAERATQIRSGKRTNLMDDKTIRRAAIRVAAKTDNPELKRRILTILKESAKEERARHEEGKSLDVGTWLKENGFAEAAAKWEKHEGEIGKKSAMAVVFPEIHELAWRHVIDFSRSNPKSRTASSPTAARVAVTERLGKKWVQDAIKRPGRVHEYLGIPEDEKIPMGKLDAAIERVKGTGNKSLLSALNLAKRLKGMEKKKADVA